MYYGGLFMGRGVWFWVRGVREGEECPYERSLIYEHCDQWVN